MPISERGKEIKRRRHRRKKISRLAKRLEQATVSQRATIAEKIRQLTPGAETVLENLELAERS